MSYCRHNGEDSEAYVIGSIMGHLECLGCRITGEPADNGLCYGFFTTHSRTEMIKHLQEHRQRGFKVPFHATRRLKREIRELGDTYL
jgi:hypothetical protein